MELVVAEMERDIIPSAPWQDKVELLSHHIDIAKRGGSLAKLLLGRALYHFRHDQFSDDGYLKLLFQAKYDTWSEFCASPEIDIPTSTARNLIAIWEYHEANPEGLTADDIMQIGHKKMSIIMPMLHQGDPLWIDRAKELTSSDLQGELRAARGQEETWKVKRLHCPLCDEPLSCTKCGYSF